MKSEKFAKYTPLERQESRHASLETLSIYSQFIYKESTCRTLQLGRFLWTTECSVSIHNKQELCHLQDVCT